MALYGTVGSLVEMRSAVKDVKPNANVDACDRFINQAIRSVCLKHTWSDLLQFVQIPIPTATLDGTVATVTGSNVINGSGTAWPVADLVNTSCPNPVRQPGMQFIKPASMANIGPGRWLLIDSAGPFPEAVAVTDIRPDGFYAALRNPHDVGFTITASSLSGLQFRVNYPFYTVIAVISDTQLWLDGNWADVTQSGVNYQILKAFCQPHPQAWRLKFAWDPIQGVPLDVDGWSFDAVQAGDPQMTASDNPTILCPAPPGGGGVPQWLIYPPQTSQRYFSAIVSTVWPRLIADQDRAPSFINPDVFILRSQALALRTKTITQNAPRDPYYDPEQANEFERLFREEVETAEQADEARLAHRLQTYQRTAFGAFSSKWLQQHPGWPTDGQGW